MLYSDDSSKKELYDTDEFAYCYYIFHSYSPTLLLRAIYLGQVRLIICRAEPAQVTFRHIHRLRLLNQ